MAPNLHHAPPTVALPVTVVGRGLPITDDLQAFARRRLAFAAGRFSSKVREATVWLDDLNGPRQGVDKRCRIVLRLAPAGAVTVTAQATNEYAAIAEAARRAGAVLNRQGKRSWAIRRGRWAARQTAPWQ